MDRISLNNGVMISRVPETAGIPRRVAVCEKGGEYFAYIANLGVGIQAVKLSVARSDYSLGLPENSEKPGLYNYDDNPWDGLSNVVPSPVAVAVIKDTVLAADTESLVLLDYRLPVPDPDNTVPDDEEDALLSSADIPARDVRAVAGYPADISGNGSTDSDERFDLAFAVCTDNSFYVYDISDPENPERKSKLTLDESPDSVRISPVNRLAFVSTLDGKVRIIDIDNPFEKNPGPGDEWGNIDENGDGEDDRLLGEVTGLTGAGAMDIDSGTGTGFVADPDPAGGSLQTFIIPYSKSDPGAECQLDKVRMRDRKYVIHGGESAEAYAEPSGTPVVWSIVHKSKDLENMQIGGDSGIVTVPPDTKNGCITIRATHRDLSCCFREMTVDIGCKCSDCDRKGTASVELGCIDIRFAMGNSKGGKPAGDIFLRADKPSPLLSTPAALRFSPLADDVTAVYGDTGILRQIIAPETVADIVVTDGSAYSIIFYDVSGDSVTTDGDGLAELGSAGVLTEWRIENPAGPGDDHTRLRITETAQNSVVRKYEYKYSDAGAQKIWHMTRGDGVLESRTETHSAGNRIVTHVKKENGLFFQGNTEQGCGFQAQFSQLV